MKKENAKHIDKSVRGYDRDIEPERLRPRNDVDNKSQSQQRQHKTSNNQVKKCNKKLREREREHRLKQTLAWPGREQPPPQITFPNYK